MRELTGARTVILLHDLRSLEGHGHRIVFDDLGEIERVVVQTIERRDARVGNESGEDEEARRGESIPSAGIPRGRAGRH